MSVNMHTAQDNNSTQNVLAINEYNSTKSSNSFEMVMSQMNIPDPSDFKKTFIQKWQTASFSKELLTILLCEIDYLDEYVTHYGEQGASFMLVSLALMLKNSCDKYNCYLARNERQGFTIIVQGGTPTDAQAFADSLCSAIKNSNTEHLASPIDKQVTLSIGASSFFPVTPSLLNAQANNALMAAKKGGGNKVSHADNAQPIAIQHYSNTQKTNIDPVPQTANQPVTTEPEVATTQNDFFSESVTTNAQSKTYRGQPLQNEKSVQAKGALQTSDDALNEGVKDAPKKKVRMYRGQIIKD